MKTTLFASALLLSWTGSLDGQAGGAAPVDACALLKQAEAEAAIGTPVLAPEKDMGKLGEIPFSHCTFKKNEDLIGVLLTVYTYDEGTDVKRLFDSTMKQTADAEPVGGFGDGAYWWKGKTTMFFIKGKHMTTVFLGTTVADPRKAAADIAEKAVSRIR